MSYSVRKAKTIFPKEGDDLAVDFAYRLLSLPHVTGGGPVTPQVVKSARKYITLDVDELDRHFTLEYEFVDSPGPRLGFLGFVLDVPSGRLLIENSQGEESPSIFNLYGYLEEFFGMRIHPKAFILGLELWKTGQIRLKEALYRAALVSEETVSQQGSLVRNLLRGRKASRDNEEVTRAKAHEAFMAIWEVTNHLENIPDSLRIFFTTLGSKSPNFLPPAVTMQPLLQETDRASAGGTDYDIREFLGALLRKHTDSQMRVRKIDTKNLSKGSEEWFTAAELMRSLTNRTAVTSKMKKSEIAAVSMLDLIRSSKMEDAYHDAVSDINDARFDSAKVKDIMTRLVDESGVTEVLQKGLLSAAKRAMTRVDPVAYLTSDMEARIGSDADSGGAYVRKYSLKKTGRFWVNANRFLGRIYKKIALVYTQ